MRVKKSCPSHVHSAWSHPEIQHACKGLTIVDIDFLNHSHKLMPCFIDVYYSLRYIEKTGRDTHPWSMRRMGIYQRYDFDSASSIWILLQPIPKAKELATSSVESKSRLLLLRHILLCSSKIQNWRYYLKDLQQKIREKVRAVRSQSQFVFSDTD